MKAVPVHKQTDKSKAPGQIVNPCFKGCYYYTDSCFRPDCKHQEEKGDRTLSDYIKRINERK